MFYEGFYYNSFVALNDLFCGDVSLRSYSLTDRILCILIFHLSISITVATWFHLLPVAIVLLPEVLAVNVL